MYSVGRMQMFDALIKWNTFAFQIPMGRAAFKNQSARKEAALCGEWSEIQVQDYQRRRLVLYYWMMTAPFFFQQKTPCHHPLALVSEHTFVLDIISNSNPPSFAIRSQKRRWEEVSNQMPHFIHASNIPWITFEEIIYPSTLGAQKGIDLRLRLTWLFGWLTAFYCFRSIGSADTVNKWVFECQRCQSNLWPAPLAAMCLQTVGTEQKSSAWK